MQVTIDGPAGVLEAQLHTPAHSDLPKAVALVAHPHPLYGGSMRNAVVQTAISALVEHHVPTVAFNFRGVGASVGTHDDGIGEVGDLEAAIHWLCARYPESQLLLAGYSFGAATILRLSLVPVQLAGVLLLAPPLSMHDFSSLPFTSMMAAAGSPPVVLIYGQDDDFTAEEHRHQLADLPIAEEREIESVGHDLGAGHRQAALEQAIGVAVSALC